MWAKASGSSNFVVSPIVMGAGNLILFSRPNLRLENYREEV